MEFLLSTCIVAAVLAGAWSILEIFEQTRPVPIRETEDKQTGIVKQPSHTSYFVYRMPDGQNGPRLIVLDEFRDWAAGDCSWEGFNDAYSESNIGKVRLDSDPAVAVAKELILEDKLSVGEISRRTGVAFDKVLVFYKQFASYESCKAQTSNQLKSEKLKEKGQRFEDLLIQEFKNKGCFVYPAAELAKDTRHNGDIKCDLFVSESKIQLSEEGRLLSIYPITAVTAKAKATEISVDTIISCLKAQCYFGANSSVIVHQNDRIARSSITHEAAMAGVEIMPIMDISLSKKAQVARIIEGDMPSRRAALELAKLGVRMDHADIARARRNQRAA